MDQQNFQGDRFICVRGNQDTDMEQDFNTKVELFKVEEQTEEDDKKNVVMEGDL